MKTGNCMNPLSECLRTSYREVNDGESIVQRTQEIIAQNQFSIL